MRTAGQIKRELIDLIWRKRLPKVKIAEDSRCSMFQLWSALKLEATETVLRRMDAYLDAGDLHKHVKGSRLLSRMEMLRDEMWYQFDAQSLPMADFMLMPVDKQKLIYLRMHMRAKKLLREKYEKVTGTKIYFSDGATYWKCKEKLKAKGITVSP